MIRTNNAKPDKVIIMIGADFDIIRMIAYATLDITKIMPTITFVHRLPASFKHKVKTAINSGNRTQKTSSEVDIY